MSTLLLLLLLLTISHLTQKIQTVSGHQVFLIDTVIRPLISLRRVWFVPARTEEVLLQTISHLEKNLEYPRGDSPEQDDLNEYRTKLWSGPTLNIVTDSCPTVVKF